MDVGKIAIETLNLLKSRKFCIGIFVASLAVMIYFRQDLPFKYYLFVFALLVLTSSFLTYDFFEFIKLKFETRQKTKQRKIEFLKEIYTSMLTGYNKPKHKYEEEVILINILYYKDLKKFTFNDIKSIKIYKDLDKNKLISSLNFLGDSAEESLIFIKDGKYEFYDNVWKELDTLSKTGLLPFKKNQELPKDTQESLKINKEALWLNL